MKSYAYYDLIGVRASIEKGGVKELLTRFWNAVDVWTNTSQSNFEAMKVIGENYITIPEIFSASFTDSAVMHTQHDHGPENFMKIALNLKSAIEQAAGPCYVVISYAAEIPQPDLPALGSNSFSSQCVPHYYRLAGSGESWANMMYADHVISRSREWHYRYSVYCVGRNALHTGIKAKECKPCKAITGDTMVYAIE